MCSFSKTLTITHDTEQKQNRGEKKLLLNYVLYLLLRHVTLPDTVPVRGHRFRSSRLLMPPHNSEEAFLVQTQIGVLRSQFTVHRKQKRVGCPIVLLWDVIRGRNFRITQVYIPWSWKREHSENQASHSPPPIRTQWAPVPPPPTSSTETKDTNATKRSSNVCTLRWHCA